MIELHTVGKNEKLTNPIQSVQWGLGATLAEIRSTARAKTTCMTARKKYIDIILQTRPLSETKGTLNPKTNPTTTPTIPNHPMIPGLPLSTA
jgi:hypothetical protein